MTDLVPLPVVLALSELIALFAAPVLKVVAMFLKAAVAGSFRHIFGERKTPAARAVFRTGDPTSFGAVTGITNLFRAERNGALLAEAQRSFVGVALTILGAAAPALGSWLFVLYTGRAQLPAAREFASAEHAFFTSVIFGAPLVLFIGVANAAKVPRPGQLDLADVTS